MYKLHPELQKEIDKMNHAQTIMNQSQNHKRSTLEDELAYIRRHKKSCCNRRKSKLSEPIKNTLEGIAIATILLAWIVFLISGFIILTR